MSDEAICANCRARLWRVILPVVDTTLCNECASDWTGSAERRRLGAIAGSLFAEWKERVRMEALNATGGGGSPLEKHELPVLAPSGEVSKSGDAEGKPNG